MIVIKNKLAIEKMRNAGTLLASLMEDVKNYLKPGVSTLEINDIIEQKMLAVGLVPECKGVPAMYRGYPPYQHATCISLNDVIVHGVPCADDILKEGDFVKIDVVGSYKGYCADMARYFFVGEQRNEVAEKMACVAQQALDNAIALIQPGKKLSDISACIQKTVESAGFGVVRDFVGHGIGKRMHEAPEVPNFGKPGNGPVLQEGMTFAIEPMITQRDYRVKIMRDGWTAKTADGGLAAHVEDTILVTNRGAEVLTRLNAR